MEESLLTLVSVIEQLKKRLEAYCLKTDAKQSFIDLQNETLSKLVNVYNSLKSFEVDELSIEISDIISRALNTPKTPDGLYIHVHLKPNPKHFNLINLNYIP